MQVGWKKAGQYFYGFLDGSISEIASRCPVFFDQMSLLITCLDSSKQVTGLSKWTGMLADRLYSTQRVHDAVWIPAEDTKRLLEDRLTFYGFDEIYMFRGRPRQPSATKRAYTTDSCNFGDSLPDGFIDQFLAMGACRYLADGCGVNFVCESQDVVTALVHSLQNETEA